MRYLLTSLLTVFTLSLSAQEVGCTYSIANNYSSTATVDDGTCIFGGVNVFDFDNDGNIAINDFIAMLSYFGDTDSDSDGVFDSVDDCIDETACNYQANPTEACYSLDAISVCGGNCSADEDADGICDVFAVGDFHQGGIIFYLDGNGGGLIVSPYDQSVSAEWGCLGTIANGAYGTAIGTGNQNTNWIEYWCTTSGTAADICSNLTLGGYTDWFLPSKDELNEIYIHRAIIDSTANANGGASFLTSYYWSSSQVYEFGWGDIYAWMQSITGGIQTYSSKSLLLNVRAVRAF